MNRRFLLLSGSLLIATTAFSQDPAIVNYKYKVDTSIITKTAVRSITPIVVGSRLKEVADLIPRKLENIGDSLIAIVGVDTIKYNKKYVDTLYISGQNLIWIKNNITYTSAIPVSTSITGGSGMTLSGVNLNLGGTTTQNTSINLGSGYTFSVDGGNNSTGTISLLSNNITGTNPRSFSLGTVSLWSQGNSQSRNRGFIAMSNHGPLLGYTDTLQARTSQLEWNDLGVRHRILDGGTGTATTRYYGFRSDSLGFSTVGDNAESYLFKMGRDSLLYTYTPKNMYINPESATGSGIWALTPTGGSGAASLIGPIKAIQVAPASASGNYIWNNGSVTPQPSAQINIAGKIATQGTITSTGSINTGHHVNQITHTSDADYSATETDYVIICDNITANRTLTFPTGSNGRTLIIQVKDAGNGNKWTTSSEFKIGNVSTNTLSTTQTLIYDDTDHVWRMIAQ